MWKQKWPKELNSKTCLHVRDLPQSLLSFFFCFWANINLYSSPWIEIICLFLLQRQSWNLTLLGGIRLANSILDPTISAFCKVRVLSPSWFKTRILWRNLTKSIVKKSQSQYSRLISKPELDGAHAGPELERTRALPNQSFTEEPELYWAYAGIRERQQPDHDLL